MSGKVNIIIDDDGDSTAKSGGAGTLDKVLVKEYDSKKAAILKLFYEEELKEISLVGGLISCEPQQGPGLKMRIECIQNEKDKVDPLIKDLDEKLDLIKEREVSVPNDAFAKLAEHMRSEEKRQISARKEDRVLYRPDIVNKIVQVLFWPGNEQTIIELERELGIKEIGGTGHRNAHSDQAGACMQSTFSKDDPSTLGGRIPREKPKEDKVTDDDYEPMEWQSTENARKVKAEIEKDFSGKLKLLVYNDSILHLPVDAIVNAANNNMAHGGGVAQVISEAAGRVLDEESRAYVNRKGLLPVSKNIVTSAGRLKYKGVIHAVGPQWRDYKYQEVKCLDDLYDTIENILFTCDKEGYKTVAMPAISAGIYGVPKQLCADMYVKAAANYSKMPGKKLPKELHVVDIDQEILDLVKTSVENYEKDPESINQRVTVPIHLASRPQSNWRGRRRGQNHGQSWNGNHGSGEHQGSSQGQGHSSTLANELHFDDLAITIEVKKLQAEKFKWGAVAQQFTLNSDLKVKIFKGDITKSVNNDALVCGIGSDMQFTGLVADALKAAGGAEFVKAVSKKIQSSKYEKPGTVLKCVAGNLKVTCVVFVVSEKLKDVDTKQQDMYSECVFNLLKKANEWNLPKIAIPLFSTGNLQTNDNKLQKCAIALIRALDKFVNGRAGKHVNVKEIHLVNVSDLVTSTLVRVFDAASKTYGHNARKPDSEKTYCESPSNYKTFTPSNNENTSGKTTYNVSQNSKHDDSGKRKYTKDLKLPTSKGTGTYRDVSGGDHQPFGEGSDGASGGARPIMYTYGKGSGDVIRSSNDRQPAISMSSTPSSPDVISISTHSADKKTGNLVIIDDDEVKN